MLAAAAVSASTSSPLACPSEGLKVGSDSRAPGARPGRAGVEPASAGPRRGEYTGLGLGWQRVPEANAAGQPYYARVQ